MKKIYLINTMISLLLLNCALIKYSPYDVDVVSSGANNDNIQLINKLSVMNDTLVFAVFSDSHFYYDQLKNAVASINKNRSVQFVICCGDISQTGLSDEFNMYYGIIDDLNIPIITAIGNHDYLSNGARVYAEMFGPSDFSFYCNSYRFVFFDDIVWENDNKSPDFNWLKNELTKDTITTTILVAHIPPWSDEFIGEYETVYQQIISQSRTLLVLNGHEHVYKTKHIAGIPSIVINTIKKEVYYIIRLYQGGYTIKQVDC